MKRNPLNDDGYRGNDKQIDDLKGLATDAIDALKAILVPYADFLRGVGADPNQCAYYMAAKAIIRRVPARRRA